MMNKLLHYNNIERVSSMSDENKQRSARFREQLQQNGFKNPLDAAVADKLEIALGTARGYVYNGKHPVLSKAKNYAEILGIDLVYWLHGIRAAPGEIDSNRLKFALVALDDFNKTHTAIDLDLDQTASFLIDIYTEQRK